MTLLVMDFKAIPATPWRAIKYSFTSIVATNRTEFSRFFKTSKNTAPPLIRPIVGDSLPHIITWKKVLSGLNLPRSFSVGGSSHLLFGRIIDHLMR